MDFLIGTFKFILIYCAIMAIILFIASLFGKGVLVGQSYEQHKNDVNEKNRQKFSQQPTRSKTEQQELLRWSRKHMS